MMQAFAEHIATLCSLTIGSTLYAGFVPDDQPDRCAALLERTPGRRDDKTRIDEWPLQIWARAVDYHGENGARALAHSIYDAVVNQQNVAITGYTYTCKGNSPAYIGTDERGRHVFSANLVLYMKAEPAEEEV